MRGDPWELIDRWRAEAERLEKTLPESASEVESAIATMLRQQQVAAALRRCAEELIEIAGPD